MSLFDIIGPVMVGPSSSHTAGAARIGLMARLLLQDQPVFGEIRLHGSFAQTGRGHGTDKALVAGILGMRPDDERIPDSFEAAEQQGFKFTFRNIHLKGAHPNTALIRLQGARGRQIEVQASSVGGGSIEVNKLDGIDVKFSGQYPTLIVYNQDRPGLVAKVASALAEAEINIATIQLHREGRGAYAVIVAETDQPVENAIIEQLKRMEGVKKVTYFGGMDGGNDDGLISQ